MSDNFKLRASMENIKEKEISMYFKSIFLFAAQSYELTETRSSRPNKIYRLNYRLQGVHAVSSNINISFGDYVSKKLPIVLFTIRFKNTISDLTLHRTIALPLEKTYEPWTEQLFGFYTEKGANYVFPFSSQKAWSYATLKNRIFDGLYYSIKNYKYNSYEGKKECVSHKRHLKANGLRRLRSYELIDKFGFSFSDLEAYRTLRLSTEYSLSTFSQEWKRYISKLFRPIASA